MKNIILLCSFLLLFYSCGKELRDRELTQAEDVSYVTKAEFLLSGTIVRTGKFYSEKGFQSDDWFSPTMQYNQLLHGGERANNYMLYLNPPANWETEYKELLQYIDSGILWAGNENLPSSSAVFQILRVFVFSYITDRYGDIPYSEAMRGREGILFPKFDTQKSIYEDFFVRLDAAIQLLSTASDNLPTSYDLIYRGNKENWIRFANSLKLRLYFRSYDAFKKAGVDNASKIQSLATGGMLMNSNEHSASVLYLSTNDFAAWPNGPLRGGGTRDREFNKRKPSVALIDALKNHNDPRLTYWIAPAMAPIAPTAGSVSLTDAYGYKYSINAVAESDFTSDEIADYPVGNRAYVGSPVGPTGSSVTNLYGNVDTEGGFNNPRISNYGDIFKDNANTILRMVFMNADEVQFLLAEGAQRGWITGNADTYYKKGIELNCLRWAVSPGEITTYLAEPSIQLGSDQLNQIATQKWLALFTVSQEAYLDYRRTKLPRFIKENADASGMITASFPLRLRYPGDETANNNEQYKKALNGLEPASGSTEIDSQNSKMWLLQ